ncbi:unnamed protein product [Agarophyton chilense]
MTVSARAPPCRRRLLNILEIPAWMRDNDFLYGSYRPSHPSWSAIFFSAFFTLHNDTINIWTHALGFVFFLCLGVYILGPATSVRRHISRVAIACSQRALATTADIHAHIKAIGVPNFCLTEHHHPTLLRQALSNLLNSHRIALFPLILTALICLFFSTIFHTFWVHSPRALHLLGKLDFLGISLLISGHAISGIYYAFYCTPTIAHRYYALIISAELFTVPCIFAPTFGTPAARPFRVFVFAALASTTVLPLFHSIWSQTAALYELAVGVGSALSALFMYAVGAMFYISRFPECCRVGMHDRFFASHQLLHIAVLLGVGFHLFGCWTLLEYRLEVGCSASPLQ